MTDKEWSEILAKAEEVKHSWGDAAIVYGTTPPEWVRNKARKAGISVVLDAEYHRALATAKS